MSSFYSSHVQPFRTPDFHTETSTIVNYNNTINSEDELESLYYISPDIQPWVFIASVIVMLLIGIFGLFGNTAIMLAYIKNDSLHNDFNRMLMNLIFAELINCSYGISLDITAAMQYGWKLGPEVCNTTGFLLTFCGTIFLSDLLGMVSIYTLAALAIQRWWIMFSNAAQTTTHDCQRAFLGAIADRLSSHTVIAIVWILSLSIALPPLFGWSYYAPEDNGISCAPVWADPDGISYIIYLLVVGWALPNVILVGSAIEVIRYQKQTSGIFTGRIAEVREKREKKLTRMVMIMVLAFNASWTPYAVVCTLKLFHRNFVSPSWAVPGLLLAKSASCWNPVIYIFLNTQFRSAILPPNLLKFFNAEPEENELSNQPRKSSNLNEETIRAMASAVTLALKPMVNQNDMSQTNTNIDKNGPAESTFTILTNSTASVNKAPSPESNSTRTKTKATRQASAERGYVSMTDVSK